jgi:hypothetical protein
MHRYRRSLEIAISGEARAYGFSVVALTVGYLAVTEHGLPGARGALAYVGGVVAAQAAAALLAFAGHPAWSPGEDVRFRSFGAIHVVSVACGVFAGWGGAAVVGEHAAAYAAAGFCAVAVYQVVLGAELALAWIGEDGGA